MQDKHGDVSQAQLDAWWNAKQRADDLGFGDGGGAASGDLDVPEVPLAAMGDVPGTRMNPSLGDAAAVTKVCRDCDREATFVLPEEKSDAQQWAENHKHTPDDEDHGNGGGH